ncbi:sensor domain-containing diguanylate cyclase [soil metagenome]
MNSGTIIPRPLNETQRLAALQRYALPSTHSMALPGHPSGHLHHPDVDFLTELAATLCGTPYAFISLVDAQQVRYFSAYGMPARDLPRDQDYCAWSILEAELLHIPDLQRDPRTASLPMTRGAMQYRMFAGANLLSSDGYAIGCLYVLDLQARQLSQTQLRLLGKLARQVMLLFELHARDNALQALSTQLQTNTIYDELTGLFHRTAMLAKLHSEMARSQRSGTELSVIMMALDNFKLTNERHGRALGDLVLRGAASLLRKYLRVTDIAARYDGDQFCVLLPNTSAVDAIRVANALRTAIADAVFTGMGHQVKVTVSIGVSGYQGSASPANDSQTVKNLLELAGSALFLAKVAGRNRVESAVTTLNVSG